jgi:hypothetical protein
VQTGLEAAREGAAILLVLVLRGLALWVVIPVVFVLWLLLAPVRWLVHGRNRPRLRQYVTWADMTLVASLERGPLRPLVRDREKFPAWPRARAEPPYRVNLADLL